VAELLKSEPKEEASAAAVLLSGRPFPVWEETTLQVGGALLWRLVQELSGKTEVELTASYRKLGDLGAVAGELLPDRVGAGDPARPVCPRGASRLRPDRRRPRPPQPKPRWCANCCRT